MPARTSIYRRLMLATLLPLLVAMAVAWAIATTIFSRTLEQRVVDQTRRAARVMTDSGLPFTQSLIDRLADLQQADFALLDADGQVALTSFGQIPPDLARQLGPPAQVAATATNLRHLDVNGAPAVLVFQPVAAHPDGRYTGLVAVASLGDARGAARDAALGLAIAMLLASTALAALIHTLVRNITAPLQGLARYADAVAAGDRESRSAIERTDEVGTLARALDDMTARLAVYERRLAERSRLSALGEMAARIAHEIRNPLTGLKLHLQLLGERAGPADAPRIQSLLDEVRRLELIVDSSLAVARDRPANPEPTDLPTLLTDVLELMQPSLEHRRIGVTTRLASLPPLAVDRALIRQAFLNLLVNAVDALPDGGRILVAAGRDDARHSAWLAVEDSGSGAPEGLLDDGLRGGASDKPFGLGLGLTVCREAAGLHGGELRLAEAVELGGARFVIELPLAPAGASPAG